MLKTAFPIALRMLPLTGALFLMAADGEACIIIDNSNGGGGGDECFDLDALCPNLVCDAGNVVVDGCAICECEEVQVCDPSFPPDCQNAFLNDDCSWTCGGGECFADVDCGDGFFCDFGGVQTPDAGGAADRIAAGVCQPLQPTGCSSDVECGPGFFCALSDGNGGGSGGEAPPAPDGDQAQRPLDGVCLPLAVECFSNDDCARGQHCEQRSPETDPNADPATGLVAPGGICVDDGAACSSDSDCDGGACFDGLCVDQGCFSDIDCGPGQACLGTDVCACTTECQDDGQGGCIPCDCANLPGICVDVTTADCSADTDCGRGQHCEFTATGCDVPACEVGPDGQEICHGCDPVLSGICVDDTLGGECAFDSDCNPDEVCVLDGATEPDCLVPEGCANRPAPAPTGTCQPVDPIPADGCYSDQDCAAGTRCNAGVDVCELPPDCVAGEACLAVCYGSCVVG